MNMETTVYEAPQIEVIEVEVERGFAGSPITGGMGESTGIGGNGTITGGEYD